MQQSSGAYGMPSQAQGRALPAQPASGGGGGGAGAAVALGCGAPLVIGCGIFTAVVAVIVVVALIVVWAVNDAMEEAGVTGPGASPTARPTVYLIGDRPGYDEMREHVQGKFDEYNAMIKDGTIWEVAPHGRDTNPAYISFFELLLVDHAGAVRFSGASSTDPDELDQIIADLRSRPDEYERKFLAGEPLSSPWFTENGEVIVVEATAPRGGGQQPVEPPSDRAAGLAAIEQQIAAYEAKKGADGTYKQAGADIAALAGMDLSYDQQAVYQFCTKNPRDNGRKSAAVFCSADPDTVYVSWDNEMYPEYASNPRFADTIRHEVAHRLILERCGTTAPPIAGEIYEGATNSYAVAYLGADYDRLQHEDPADVYHMSEETDRMAQDIHAGVCE